MSEGTKAKETIIKGHCPYCGPDRFADVVGHHVTNEDDDESGVWFRTDLRLLQCRGCGVAYVQKSTMFSEDQDHHRNPFTGEWETFIPSTITYWPSPARREEPTWLNTIGGFDTDLGNLMNDVYGALNADLRVPAAIALRTVFDRTSELLEVNPAYTFTEKLQALLDQGKISVDEKDTLNILTDAGNAAAHRGWRPSLGELDTMASIIESFLHRTFVLGEAARKLKEGIPPRPARGGSTPPPPNP